MILRRRLLFRTFNDPLERAWIIYNETLKWDLNLAITDYFWQVFSLSLSLSNDATMLQAARDKTYDGG